LAEVDIESGVDSHLDGMVMFCSEKIAKQYAKSFDYFHIFMEVPKSLMTRGRGNFGRI